MSKITKSLASIASALLVVGSAISPSFAIFDRPLSEDILAMAKPPKQQKQKSGEAVNENLGRYIVTHQCDPKSAISVLMGIAPEPYELVREFEATSQFVVKTTEKAISMLRLKKCVIGIDADRPSSPTGS